MAIDLTKTSGTSPPGAPLPALGVFPAHLFTKQPKAEPESPALRYYITPQLFGTPSRKSKSQSKRRA